MQSRKPHSKVLKHFILFFLIVKGHEGPILSEFIWALYIFHVGWQISMYYVSL